jgi:predicted nucleic acid-binding Zn ribbon protein
MSAVPLHSSPKCVICAADLEPRARKCVKCGAYQDGRNCKSCGLTIPCEANACPSCKVLQEGKPCRVCGATIDNDAKRCSACQSWQKWWRRLVPASEVALALILSIISVTAAIARPIIDYLSNRSNTYIRVVGDYSYKDPDASLAEDTIKVLVTNTGKRDSVIKSASITFDENLDAAPAQLQLMKSDPLVVEPGKHVEIHLVGPVSRLHGKTKDQVLKQLEQPGHVAKITMTIVETDRHDIATDTLRKHEDFDLSKIKQWMIAHVQN